MTQTFTQLAESGSLGWGLRIFSAGLLVEPWDQVFWRMPLKSSEKEVMDGYVSCFLQLHLPGYGRQAWGYRAEGGGASRKAVLGIGTQAKLVKL